MVDILPTEVVRCVFGWVNHSGSSQETRASHLTHTRPLTQSHLPLLPHLYCTLPLFNQFCTPTLLCLYSSPFSLHFSFLFPSLSSMSTFLLYSVISLFIHSVISPSTPPTPLPGCTLPSSSVPSSILSYCTSFSFTSNFLSSDVWLFNSTEKHIVSHKGTIMVLLIITE